MSTDTMSLLTNSSMNCFRSCPRRYWLAYEQGVRPDRPAQPLRMGQAFHRGLELRAKGYAEDEAIIGATTGYAIPPLWCETNEQVHKWNIERETVAQLLAGHFWRWSHEPMEHVATEQTFEMPLRNPESGRPSRTFWLAGKFDGIVRLPDGRMALYEAKTTGDSIDPDSDYWRCLRMDAQISLYTLAARLMEYDVQTIIYDVTRKPSIAPKQIPLLDDEGAKIVLGVDGERVFNKNGSPRQSGDASKGWTLQSATETPYEFGERLTDDIVERPDFYFARMEIPRLDADLEEFKFEVWQIGEMIRDCRRYGRWPRNVKSCIGYGKCPYFELCANGVDVTAGVPSGFVRVDDVHPELGEVDDGNNCTTEQAESPTPAEGSVAGEHCEEPPDVCS